MILRRFRAAFAALALATAAFCVPASAVAQVSQWGYGVNPATGNGRATYPGDVQIGTLGGAGGCVQADASGNLSSSGAACAGSGISLSSPQTWTGQQSFVGNGQSNLAAVLTNSGENVNVFAGAPTGTIRLNVSLGAVLYYTQNASANWTLNIAAGSSTNLNTALAIGQAVTVVFIAPQGTTAYYMTQLQIDGVNVTPLWQGGSAPTSGNASGDDVYTFTIIKTAASTYTVLASLTQF